MGPPKTQTVFFLQHQWMPLDGWKEHHGEMKWSEVILVPAKWAQEFNWS